MINSNGRTSEAEIADVVVKILSQIESRQASYADLVQEIPKHITLTDGDLAPSKSRPNEAVWEQRLRNITSHKNAEGNFIFEGVLRGVPGGLSLP